MNSLDATNDFLSFLFSIQTVSPMTVLATLLLTLGRLLPITVLAPFLGAKNVPRTVKMMFALALTMLFLPYNLSLLHREIPFATLFIGLMLKEVAIGFFLGFFASLPFYIAQSAGTLIDHSRGASSLQVSDPTTQSQTGPIGILYNYVLIAVFFSLGGPFLFFDAVATSYQVMPVDGILSEGFFSMNLPVWKQVFKALQRVMDLAVQLSAPALVGVLLTNLFLGIANRLAPQVQIVFLGIPLTSWVGIALMTAAWTLTIKVLGKESIAWVKAIKTQLLHSFP